MHGFTYLQFVFSLVCKFVIIALWHCWPLDMKYVVLQTPTMATLAFSDNPAKHAIWPIYSDFTFFVLFVFPGCKTWPTDHTFFYYFRLKYPFSNYYKRKPVVKRVAGRISPIPFLSISNFSIANEHPMPGFVGSFHRRISLITIGYPEFQFG